MIANDEDESKTSPGNMQNPDADKITDRFIKNIRMSINHLSQWRKDAVNDYDLYSGNQWEDKDISLLAKQNRPATVFNLTMRIVNYICGLEITNRQEVKLYPRRTDANGLTDLGNDAMKYVRDKCDAEDEDSEVFRDAAICGLGFSETFMDYEENPDGDIKIVRVDPLDIYYDPSAKKKNLADKKWIARKNYFTKEEIEERWGDSVIEDYELVQFDEDTTGINHKVSPDMYKNPAIKDRKDTEGKIAVYEYQEERREYMYSVANPMTGQVENISIQAFQMLSQRMDLSQVRAVKIPVKKYYKHFFVGNRLVESIPLECNMFTLNTITCFYDRNANTYFGLCRLMRDPQMWKNKLFSQIIHIFNLGAKGGLIVEKGVFTNIQDAMENWAKTDSIIEVVPGGLQRLMPKQPPTYPANLQQLMEYSEKAISEVTGISEESLGMAGRNQPFVLEHLRTRQGTIQHASLFDANRRYRKMQGRIVCKYIQTYISDGRLIRISGQDKVSYLPLLRKDLSNEYDVVVDEAPNSPNVKERVFEVLMQIIPMALQAGIPIPPEVLDFAPIPESLASKWKQRVMTPNPTTQQLEELKIVLTKLQAQGAQLANEKLAAEVGRTLSEIPLNDAKSKEAIGKGADQSALAMQKMGIAHTDMQIKQNEVLMDAALNYVDMMLTQQRKADEAKLNAAVKLATHSPPSSSQSSVMQ